ncbi:WD40/YVTN/BNR-like repeat-containing protein [Aeromonas lusitana]|uniref:Glycosyl hydrolase n=1 Tax=Aeromonas lusitana TaxID=931529 RepID=A0A2M8HCF6_9GAMM|nr:YCF48-related protein [Aeromonas lusitana]PJC94220.1 glycosyl hydrolase [Aeromonas lusitana]
MGSFKTLAPLMCCALLMQSAGVQAGQAADYVDVLDLPAKASLLAEHSPLLSLARAGNRLVAVGQRGHILYSDDEGLHWQQARVPVSVDLTAVVFPTRLQGWAVGGDGVVLHSQDGGASWQKQLDGRQIGDLVLNHYSALAKAEPQSELWPQLVEEGQRLVEEGADKPLLGVWFQNERVGYVVGVFNLILRTDDGGLHWTPMQDRTDNPQGLHLNAITQAGSGLYLAGEQGLLRKWDEGQQRFLALPSPYEGSFFGLIGQENQVIVYGLRGHVYRSTDEGASWTRLASPLPISISAAVQDGGGQVRLFTQTGHLLRVDGNQPLQLVPQSDPSPVAGAALAQDGALALVGSRGVRTLAVK